MFTRFIFYFSLLTFNKKFSLKLKNLCVIIFLPAKGRIHSNFNVSLYVNFGDGELLPNSESFTEGDQR